jgi:diacylglycerol kinase (ATP)
MNYKGQSFFFRMRYALSGIKHTWQNEVSFRTQVRLAVLALSSLFIVRPPMLWVALVVVMVCLVLVLELVNTAVEQVLDGLHPGQAEFVRIAKDCAAGAVFVASLAALCIYIMMLVFLVQV